MKNFILSLSILTSISVTGTSFASVKKDECFNSIMTATKSIAAVNSKAIGIKAIPDSTFYQIMDGGFFYDLNKVAPKDIKDSRQYQVRVDNGNTYQYWQVEALSRKDLNMVGCVLRSFKSL